ncbi:MAG: DNA-processing protein DprA [Patescibacteria group bacterium]
MFTVNEQQTEATTASINIHNQNYPAQLKQIHNPPQELFYKGDLETLKKTCISIVGTRRNSDYGEELTRQIVKELSVLDIAIVSGLAKGIDTIAHEAALQNNLPTIAVLGSGIDNIYPRQNFNLSKEIIKANGLIISEYAGTAEPSKFNFPQRNRIISGLSIATIVIEAPEESGALITARFALEQGREIFVVPGDVDRITSRGSLRLLQNGGAYPIGSGQDVIDILRKPQRLFKTSQSSELKLCPVLDLPVVSVDVPNQKSQTLNNPKVSYKTTEEEDRLLSIFHRHRGLTIDKIIQKLPIPISQILTTISILEINGLITMKDGRYFRKC